MTYQERYVELYNKYENAGKELEQATKKISELRGFGDSEELSNYFDSHKNFVFHEKQFQEILRFLKNGNIDPSTEFVESKYMYEYIRQDQILKGNWEEGKENQFFTLEVGLTNNPEIPKDYQQSHYRFPVLNVEHGKECYQYLAEKLGTDFEKLEPKIVDLDFTGILDLDRPIFIKVSMRSK